MEGNTVALDFQVASDHWIVPLRLQLGRLEKQVGKTIELWNCACLHATHQKYAFSVSVLVHSQGSEGQTSKEKYESFGIITLICSC